MVAKVEKKRFLIPLLSNFTVRNHSFQAPDFCRKKRKIAWKMETLMTIIMGPFFGHVEHTQWNIALVLRKMKLSFMACWMIFRTHNGGGLHTEFWDQINVSIGRISCTLKPRKKAAGVPKTMLKWQLNNLQRNSFCNGKKVKTYTDIYPLKKSTKKANDS